MGQEVGEKGRHKTQQEQDITHSQGRVEGGGAKRQKAAGQQAEMGMAKGNVKYTLENG